MKTIKVELEYGCYPVWVYGDDGFIESNALPSRLAEDTELDRKFKKLQERFDATFVDTPTEFTDKGFATPEDEARLAADLETAVDELAERCPKGYSFEPHLRR